VRPRLAFDSLLPHFGARIPACLAPESAAEPTPLAQDYAHSPRDTPQGPLLYPSLPPISHFISLNRELPFSPRHARAFAYRGGVLVVSTHNDRAALQLAFIDVAD